MACKIQSLELRDRLAVGQNKSLKNCMTIGSMEDAMVTVSYVGERRKVGMKSDKVTEYFFIVWILVVIDDFDLDQTDHNTI